MRGRVKAFDARNGKLLWTFYTIPGPASPATTPGPRTTTPGSTAVARCGRRRRSIPSSGLIYFSTGNPGPDFNGAVRPGDNLFTASIVAVEAQHRQVPLALPAGAPRHLGLRRAESRRAVRRDHRRRAAQGPGAGGQDRLGLHPRSRDGRAADRHRRAPGAAGAAPGHGGDAALSARRRHRAAADRHRARRLRAGERRPHLHAVLATRA